MMALLFLGLSAWTFVNEDRIEAWLPGQVAEQATTAQNQLPLQDNETWLVVVVDFPEHRADNGWGPDEATWRLSHKGLEGFYIYLSPRRKKQRPTKYDFF